MAVHLTNKFPYSYSISVARKTLAHFLEQPADDIFCTPLTGGSEEGALIKCTYLATSYVVKFFSSNQSGKKEIAWTQHASDLGSGPRLYYADPAGSYMLIEWVKGNSLVPAVSNAPAFIKNCATAIARLHNSSLQGANTSDIWMLIDEKYKKLLCSGPLKDMMHNGMLQVKKIKTVLEDLEVPVVPCHKDLNPGNIFVYNSQVTLIDWGDSALSNPYYDIAAFLVLNGIHSEGEKLFFEHYKVKFLDAHGRSYIRFYKQLVYFEFALNLLLGVQARTRKDELLHSHTIPHFDSVNSYLTLLALKEGEITPLFLYTMALASLSEMALTVL
ncbi:phosphotransferase [Candidatus Dependentiae bacterium]|nr:phosphotransferase [Candidatus Dependentiae bacterium]